jgi:hypothetical protein
MEVYSNTTDTPTLKMVRVNSSKTYYYAPYQIKCFYNKKLHFKKSSKIVLKRWNGKITARVVHNYTERIHKAIDRKISPTGNFFSFIKSI